jgi:hypothetical protein
MNTPSSFPPKSAAEEIGLVRRSSRVPCDVSSEKVRILSAGIRRRKSRGLNSKKVLKDPSSVCKRWYGVSKNHKAKVVITKKPPTTK